MFEFLENNIGEYIVINKDKIISLVSFEINKNEIVLFSEDEKILLNDISIGSCEITYNKLKIKYQNRFILIEEF